VTAHFARYKLYCIGDCFRIQVRCCTAVRETHLSTQQDGAPRCQINIGNESVISADCANKLHSKGREEY